MISYLRHSFLLFTLIIAAGCSSLRPSIVKKPDIHQVKKVAIISVTAPQRVPYKSGKGEAKGWDERDRQAIGDQALSAYATEFKKLGWEVIPTAKLSTLPAYKENFTPRHSKANNGLAKALNTLSAMDAKHLYFSPTGLFPVTWEEDGKDSDTLRLDLANLSLEKTKTLKTKMQEVASQAGADAAVLVQADYCYDNGSIWVGHVGSSTGSAVITGDSAVYAVTPQGVDVIKMKRIPGACGGEQRVASDSSTAMVDGHLLISGESAQKMFQQVSQKCAAKDVMQIQKAMKE